LLSILSKTSVEETLKCGFHLCIAKGVYQTSIDEREIVFSPNLDKQTTQSGMRRRGRRIHFNDDSVVDPDDCWILCGVKALSQHKTIFELKTPENPLAPTTITRPDDLTCPCCLDALTGVLITCPNQHQTCNACFTLLPMPKRCPTCRSNYSAEEINKASNTRGNQIRTLKSREFGYNHGKGNDYLFLHHLKTLTNVYLNPLHAFIISSLWRFLDFKNKPLLRVVDKTKSVYVKPNEDQDLAWNDFYDYLYSAENLKLTAESTLPIRTQDYNDTKFLQDLQVEYGLEAIRVLTEQSADEKSKQVLRRRMWLKSVAPQTKSFVFELINTTYEYMTLKPNHYRTLIEIVELEEVVA
jgi:hypothetical protein